MFRRRHDFGLETLASVRQVEARRASAEAELRSYDERIGLQGNAIAALSGQVRTADSPLRARAPTLRARWGCRRTSRPICSVAGPTFSLRAPAPRPPRTASMRRRRASIRASICSHSSGVQSLGIRNLVTAGSQVGSAGAAVSLPIFNTRRLQGALRGARAEYDASVATYNATLSQALREVADAATSRKALDGELEASRAAVTAAAEAHQLVRNRYKGALATYLDVLEAEDELISRGARKQHSRPAP